MNARSLVCLIPGLLCLPPLPEAAAFPPAPTFTLHGVARDAFGWALKASDEAVVVVKNGTQVVAEGAVNEAIRPGENFRVAIPMNTGSTAPYPASAQTTGNQFSIEVRFPTGTMPVLSIQAEQRTVGKPGEMLAVHFTLGVDSDGDGIPDQWEWWQLSEAGYGPGHPKWSLATFGNGDSDGDGISDSAEYLAGTFAFLNSDSLELTIIGFTPRGEAILEMMQVEGKTYRVDLSNDMQIWTRAHLRRDHPEAETGVYWTAADTRDVTLYSPASVTKPNLFYRLILVR